MTSSLSSAPRWFQTAIATPARSAQLDLADGAIHYKSWGDPNKPSIILVHGNGAHAHWWDFIAPAFAERYHVVAMDLAGMGHSAHRDHYSADAYARDILALSQSLRGKPPLLIGHSLGGRLSCKAVQLFPDAFHGVIMADSPFNPHTRHIDFESRKQEVKPNRVYSSFEEAKSRYRLFPAQPCANEFIVDYLAETSLKQVDEGWTWKFDAKIWPTFDFKSLVESQPNPEDKILGLIYGERSALFSEEIRRYNEDLYAQYNFPAPIPIADAHHHLFLDQPLAFIAVIEQLLERNYPSS